MSLLPGLRINAFGLISGMFYTSRFDKIGLFLPKYLYGRDYKKTPFAKYVNPENRELLNSLAPVWLVTSHNDFLRRYTTDFEKALTRAEREHELVVFPKNKKAYMRSVCLSLLCQRAVRLLI